MKRILCALLFLLNAGLAAATPASVPVAAPSPVPEADLRYLNRSIVTFRAPLLGVSPTDRARRGLLRLEEHIAHGGPLLVSVKPTPIGQMVHLDETPIFALTADDLDSLGNETLDAATARAVTRFEQVIRETRESRDAKAWWQGILWSTLATVVAVLLVRLVFWLRRLGQSRLLRWSAAQIERLRIGDEVVVHRGRVLSAVRFVLSAAITVFLALVTYEWLSVVLAQFPFTRPWGELLNNYLLDLLKDIALGIAGAVPGLVTALIIFVFARIVARAVSGIFSRVQSGHIHLGWMDADLAGLTRRLAVVLIWLFALAMAYPYLPGSESEAFKGISVLVGLMVSLGASSLVGQAASGLILTYARVYRRGEFVRIGEHEGTVIDVGMFITRIRTGMGEELTLSNATILSGTTTNYSRAVQGKGFVIDVKVTIGYDTPWRQVHALLELAATRTAGVLATPAPQVFQTALSDWYPEYRLVCQAIPSGPDTRAKVISALHANIQDTFNEFGVQIMSPQYFEDPPTPKIVPPENWYAAPAAPAPAATASAARHA